MLEWSYITRRVYEDDLFNDFNENTLNQYCNAGKYQQIETSLAIDYIKAYDLGSEMEKELIKHEVISPGLLHALHI